MYTDCSLLWMNREKYGYYGKASLDFSLSIIDRKPISFKDWAKTQEAWKKYAAWSYIQELV